MSESTLIPAERIERRILFWRGQKVLLDRDLAALYGVETRVLNQAVRRNIRRFPEDFMFALNREEILRISQFVTSSRQAELKYSKNVLAFTEQGVAMLSGILTSPRAVEVNIAIMRAFVQLRQLLSTHADLARKLASLESKYDQQFKVVFEAIRELMKPPTAAQKREIGFHSNLSERATKPRSRTRTKASP
ncbi:MAG: ORF6N domain-containing protein [Opitutaceae bacterium]|nr:ORF6N domain-containing protein [Verrucomicrobiales bacterium]